MRREECDDGIDLVRRSRRATEKALGGRISASQIAAELGNVTRNAVIGKVHRLGLSGRAKSPSSAAPRQRKARPAQHMMRVSRPVSRGNTALAHAFEVEMEPDPIAFDNVVPMSQRLSLLELNEATCHWPVGDPSSPGILLLRRQGARGPALLRASLARRLSARLRPPPPGAEADAVRRRSSRIIRRSSSRANAGTHNHRHVRGYALRWGSSAFQQSRFVVMGPRAFIAGTTMVRA